jgi:hypothetical protein
MLWEFTLDSHRACLVSGPTGRDRIAPGRSPGSTERTILSPERARYFEAIDDYLAPLGLMTHTHFPTQGVALGYPIAPLWAESSVCNCFMLRGIFDTYNFERLTMFQVTHLDLIAQRLL